MDVEENLPELEEGEAFSFDDDDHNSKPIDIDTDLSYIDDKLQYVLGHFQKDFEGGVSADNLGKMFGGYGSFLLSDECSSTVSSIWPEENISQKISRSPKSPNNLCLNGGSWMCKVAPGVAQSRHEDTPCGATAFRNPAMASEKVSVKPDPCLPSTQLARRINSRDENPNQSCNIYTQRPLKLRIKVGSVNMVQKNAAIYSGLGLDDSPSLSSGNSIEKSSDMLPQTTEVDVSPTGILQIMTSFPVPGSDLISPLHDSLLCICKREKVSSDAKPVILLKGKKEAKTGNACADELRNRLLLSATLKEDSMELISAQSSGRIQKRNAQSCSNEKSSKHTVSNKEMFVEQRKTVGGKYCKISEPSKDCYAVCNGGDPNLEVGVSLKSSQQAIGKKFRNKECETVKPGGRKTKLVKGKNLQQNENDRNTSSLTVKERLDVVSGIVSKHTVNISHDVFRSKSNIHKLTPIKKMTETREGPRADVDPKVETTKPSCYRLKDSSINTVEMKHSEKLEEKFGVKTVDNLQAPIHRKKHLQIPRLSVEAAAYMNPQDNMLTELLPPVSVAAWVQCDICEKWRLLPSGIKPEDLPEKWMCHMLTWLPGMNSCNISEDETTKAFDALYGSISLQSRGAGAASKLHFAVDQCDRRDHKTLDSPVMSLPGKGKHGLNGTKAGRNCRLVEKSKFSKSTLLDSVKSRSLNDMSQPDSELSSVTGCSSVQMSEAKEQKLINKREGHYDPGRISKRSETEDIAAQHDSSVDHRVARVTIRDGSNIKVGATQMKIPKQPSIVKGLKCGSRQRLMRPVKVGNQSLDGWTSNKAGNPMKKRKLMEWQENEYSVVTNSCAEESSDSGLNKIKKLRISKTVVREPDAKSVRNKPYKRGVLYPGRKEDKVNVLEEGEDIIKGAPPLKTQKLKVTSHQNLDVVSAQVFMTASSSSSKVSGSHKTRGASDDIRKSPLGSVSSSLYKTMLHKKLTLARKDNLGMEDAVNHRVEIAEAKSGELHMSNALQLPGNTGNKGDFHILEQLPSGLKGAVGPCAKRTVRTNSSTQIANNDFKESEKRRDYTNKLKSSRLTAECTEENFQAALSFLRRAFLRETSCSEGGRHGEMPVVQVYHHAAKLFESCAFEYERRHKMAAAALAYKSMEVACLRMVYCRSSSLSTDLNELHESLETTIEGESPSSSASDLDNLNNHVTVDKATLSKSTLFDVAGNATIAAGNNSKLARIFNIVSE
ncbi:Cysteine-tryptophan domain-containing zinc finger protein 7 [Linum perenne]